MIRPSIVQVNEKCYQCGFPHTWKKINSDTMEWNVTCPRCGYFERWKHVSRFSNGHLEKGFIEVIYSAGAYFAKWANTECAICGSLSETDVEKTAAKMRADIASGKLSPESYVTRYNFDTHEVTAVVGRIPTPDPVEQESELEEGICEAVDEQEVDDLPYEV